MKKIYVLLFFFLSISCSKERESEVLSFDLTDNGKELLYTEIVKSIDYLVLNTNDTCLLSGVEKLYIDNDTLIVKDTKKGGVVTFGRNGEFIKQINYIGEGPTEYHNANSIAVDTVLNHIYIYDMMNFKINKYTYQGVLVESNKTDYFMRDFEVADNSHLFMMQPNENKAYKKNGVWLTSSQNRFVKQLIEHESNNQNFEFISTYANNTSEGLYYYDRNNDGIYLITPDSALLVYAIDLKQRIPNEVRELPEPSLADLNRRAMMNDFCVSSKYLIFNYFIFGDTANPFRWVLLNRVNGKVSVSLNFKNNMDTQSSSESKVFHINDSTWCRVLDPKENDCNVVLQILHLK